MTRWYWLFCGSSAVAIFSPLFLGRADGSTLLGGMVAAFAVTRLLATERPIMELVTIDRTPTEEFADNRAVLEFEEKHPRAGGKKDEAIHRTFNVTPTRYYARLNELLLTQEAREIHGNLVNRLNRLSADRAAERERRFAGRAS